MKVHSSPGGGSPSYTPPLDSKHSGVDNSSKPGNGKDTPGSGLETSLSAIRTGASVTNAGTNAYGAYNKYGGDQGQQSPAGAGSGNSMISFGSGSSTPSSFSSGSSIFSNGSSTSSGLQTPASSTSGANDSTTDLAQKLTSLLTQFLGLNTAQGSSSTADPQGDVLPSATQPAADVQQPLASQTADGTQNVQSASPFPGVVGDDGKIIATEQDTSQKPTESTGRPAGDTRSAEEIIDANPILKNLGDQKDINREGAYKQLGDFSDKNTDPKSRADAAYNAAKVLNYIDSSDTADGKDRKEVAGKGDLYGITKDGDARHGTPAGNWKDFTEKGYGALKDDHRLDKTNDSHVRADGTNKDNFQWFAGEVGKKLWFIPGLSNVLTGIGDSKGGFLGALKGAAGGVLDTWKGVAEGVANSFKGGRINPASLLLGAYTGALSNTKAAPEEVKDIAGKL
jgi:hypothetical protein